jgi:dTDP-4-dehydrorhamnose reductase
MRVLVTGASGQLGRYVVRELVHISNEPHTPDAPAGEETGLASLARRGTVDAAIVAWSGTRGGDVCGVPLQPIDLTDLDRVANTFRAAAPTVVIHAAAMASVAQCFREPARARLVNTDATATLAELAAGVARFVYVSTDLVFDGERAPYSESDPPAPLSVYGRTKADAEHALRETSQCVIVRISLLYGPSLSGRPSFFDQQVAGLRAGRPITLFHDEWRTPLDLATAAQALVAIARSDFTGTLHVGGPARMSRLEMGERLARFLGADPSLIVASSRGDAGFTEPRPRDTSLDSSRWRSLFAHEPWPQFESALSAMGVTS